MEHVLGPTSTRWMDYVGTAAADDAEVLAGTRSPYELAGLDREQWTIVAVDLFLGARPQVAVYARPAGTLTEGSVAVTQFRISAAEQVQAFVAEAFRTVAVRLVDARMSDETLVVTDVVTV